MTDDVTIYHNPRCSKSRQTLQLLQERGIEPNVVEYLKTPPTPEELSGVLDKLGMMAVELIRTGEQEYVDLGLLMASYDNDGYIQVMCEHPKLIERPIVVMGDKAAIGRPPENVLAMLPEALRDAPKREAGMSR